MPVALETKFEPVPVRPFPAPTSPPAGRRPPGRLRPGVVPHSPLALALVRIGLYLSSTSDSMYARNRFLIKRHLSGFLQFTTSPLRYDRWRQSGLAHIRVVGAGRVKGGGSMIPWR